ncbi:helix-turn-helix domain-containing protein [Streptomyces sp. NPDC004539]|uniref:winged helix-turn-helix transcriptional regulator n=1 Tax=Streptomyces sp. NPDC004539 TaxID=3154280 RepID=UPI0033B65474
MSATNSDVPDPLDKSCPIREVLDRVGDKWSTLIVVRLGKRTHRFNELHREIDGISQRMLTLTLRNLARDGLVSRTVYPSVPPRVDYELTELGRTLLTPITALHEWAVAHRDDIHQARVVHDHTAAAESGSVPAPA